MKIFFLLGNILSFSPEMYCWKNESWLTDAQPYWLGTPTTNGDELASVVMLTPLLCIMYQHLIHHHASGLKIFNSVLFMILVRHLHRLNHVYNAHHGHWPSARLLSDWDIQRETKYVPSTISVKSTFTLEPCEAETEIKTVFHISLQMGKFLHFHITITAAGDID